MTKRSQTNTNSSSLEELQYFELTKQEQSLEGNQILAKEELNLNLYVRKNSNNLQTYDYLKHLKKEEFWTEFRKMKLWRQRTPDLTAEQLYHSFYTKVYVPKIQFKVVVKLFQLIKGIKEKKGYYFINRYNSAYPFTYLGLFLLSKSEFKKSLKYIQTTPIFISNVKKQRESFGNRMELHNRNDTNLKKRVLRTRLAQNVCQTIIQDLDISDPIDKLYLDFYERNQQMMKKLYSNLMKNKGRHLKYIKNIQEKNDKQSSASTINTTVNNFKNDSITGLIKSTTSESTAEYKPSSRKTSRENKEIMKKGFKKYVCILSQSSNTNMQNSNQSSNHQNSFVQNCTTTNTTLETSSQKSNSNSSNSSTQKNQKVLRYPDNYQSQQQMQQFYPQQVSQQNAQYAQFQKQQNNVCNTKMMQMRLKIFQRKKLRKEGQKTVLVVNLKKEDQQEKYISPNKNPQFAYLFEENLAKEQQVKA